MRFLLLALAVPFALADDHPIPTPRPTITPAPESECNYEDEAMGPFALDCLQALFLEKGCSMRGTSYPNEVDEDPGNGDKSIYNGLSWTAVGTLMDDLTSNTLACRGSPTPTPTGEPVASPTSMHPTPSPTRIPTTDTPAPTYPEDTVFTLLVDSATAGYTDATDAATKIGEACETAGYSRQYDATQYVVKLTMGVFSDYYTVEPVAEADGSYTSICEMLVNPVGTALWSDNVEGPFMAVDLTSTSLKQPDGRVFPLWLDTRGDNSGQGYGTVGPDDLTAVGNTPYTLEITSKRTFWECVERVDPANYVAPCGRGGTELQDWTENPPMCDTSLDNTNLLYAMANKGFKTCDDRCVYHPDYTHGLDDGSQASEYWYWVTNTSGGCWKSRSEYTSGEFQDCDPTHSSHLYGDSYAFLAVRQERLCSERCDHVNGWRFLGGSCYKLIDSTDYDQNAAATNFEQANATCGEMATDGVLASITSEAENDIAIGQCQGICYLGNDYSTKGTAEGGWLDGSKLIWSNWHEGFEGSSGAADGDDYVILQEDGTWLYTGAGFGYNALCEAPANVDGEASNEDVARFCMADGASHEVMQTNVFPELDIAASGFTDAANPGRLHLHVNIPKYFYNAKIAFENSTNDAAEYNWAYANSAWDVNANTNPITDGADECENAMQLEGKVDWTVFNLGGAGGVQRLATWETSDGTTVTQYNPDSNLAADNYENSMYMFGSVMRIEAKQPVFTSIDEDGLLFKQREAYFERTIVARIPFILQFQKTVTVSTDVDIISTKFNYKTVAAIIQSVQYDTQFFAPPYAVVKLQIRTKSQYPYLFNNDASSVQLHPKPADTDNNNVAMSLAWLHDDRNCTFTNPDHTREGDICTQEWMLTLTPDANVCYATGEYSLEFEADCFYGKEVCYLPFDADGAVINTVTFTFKVQTSKFCPTVADEVDLSGTLTVTGRESFKPDEEGVEDNTDGSFYLQGEMIHLFAETFSEKAVITATEVVLVELEQNLSTLVMTGYNRVPYDTDILDLTVWSKDAAGRVADGTVTLNDGSGDVTVQLMDDTNVFGSGHNFDGGYTFEANEAGFQIRLHSKAFPVNVDSFGSKTLIATLAVEYEALNGLTRRRLLSSKRDADVRSRAEFNLKPWTPKFGSSKGDVVTMAMEMSFMQSSVTRKNVRGFIQGFEDSIITALKAEAHGRIYEQQIVVEAVYSKGTKIWSRPTSGSVSVDRRKLLSSEQLLRVDFTMTNAPVKGAMTVEEMVKILDKQLRSPSSPLMVQPMFYGSVFHRCVKIAPSDYRMRDVHVTNEEANNSKHLFDDYENTSDAVRSLPLLALALFVTLW